MAKKKKIQKRNHGEMLYLRGRWKASGVRKRGGKTEKNRVPVVTQERFNKKKSESQSKTD